MTDHLHRLVPKASLTRRRFLGTATSGIGALVGACGRPPAEKILPYHEVPPELTPGLPLHYATCTLREGYAIGLVVRTREGRPIKVEGNPEHPAALGAAGVPEQASIFDLYDPRRAWTPDPTRVLADPARIDRVFGDATAGGEGSRLLLPPTSSPLREALLTRLVAARPGVKVTFWTPWPSTSEAQSRALFGRPLLVQHDFTRAARVLLLDADVLGDGPFALRHARDLASRRRIGGSRAMSRIWSVGPKPTCSSMFADRTVACRGDEVAGFAAAVVAALAREPHQVAISASRESLAAVQPGVSEHLRAAAREVAADLATSQGAAVVVAGARQPAPVHAIAWLLNSMLGAIGSTVWWTEPVRADVGAAEQSFEDLVAEMHAGTVRALLVAGLDPVYAALPDLGFEDALRRVPISVASNLFADATARACRWSIPAAHDFERWGDARAYDGTLSFVQPLVEPLHGGYSVDEIVARLGGFGETSHRLLHELWLERWGEASAVRLEQALSRGFVAGTDAAITEATPPATHVTEMLALAASTSRGGGLEIGWHADAPIADGTRAWNPWLQELPDPMTKLTWGNAAIVGPRTARSLAVQTGDLVELALGDAIVEAPVFVLADHAEETVSVQLGYGQARPLLTDFDFVGPWDPPPDPVGFDAHRLRRTNMGAYAAGLEVRPTGRSMELAITQDHQDQHDRHLAVAHALSELEARGELLLEHLREPKEHLGLVTQEDESPQWGMVVDLTLCNGCSACVVACQAENNVATVGRAQVILGREMHWLRIDRYVGTHAAIVQPMLCQHCELAPCEYVCPVNATVHSPDGLNEMVYNRCVGTRFCSNNCPYYVRRFNWFDYEVDPSRALQKNPDVTVRERGVMEKCTYCVQRIRRAQIGAELEARDLVDGEVVTACQQACPTRAISFGDVADPTTEVSRWRARPHRYAVMNELGTRPRTQYLARIRNDEGEGQREPPKEEG